MFNIFVGVVPGIVWLIIFSLFNKNIIKQEYKRLLILFLIGGIGSYLCYRLEMHFGSYFKKTVNSNYWEILFYAIFGVAIFEEGYKWFFLLMDNITKKVKKNYYTLYSSIFISVGFATIENIVYYAIPYGYEIAFGRIITAFFSHIANALWMGYFLEKFNNFKGAKKVIYIILSLVVPIILHALYNSFLYGNGKYEMYFSYYYSFLFVSTIFLSVIIFKEGRNIDGIRKSN